MQFSNVIPICNRMLFYLLRANFMEAWKIQTLFAFVGLTSKIICSCRRWPKEWVFIGTFLRHINAVVSLKASLFLRIAWGILKSEKNIPIQWLVIYLCLLTWIIQKKSFPTLNKKWGFSWFFQEFWCLWRIQGKWALSLTVPPKFKEVLEREWSGQCG